MGIFVSSSNLEEVKLKGVSLTSPSTTLMRNFQDGILVVCNNTTLHYILEFLYISMIYLTALVRTYRSSAASVTVKTYPF